MRSRYSAYAKGLVDYIQKTTHPKSPHYIPDRKKWSAAILEFTRLSTFVRLEILGYGEDWVEFAAHLIQGGKPLVLREKSRFEQVQGRWCYLSGDVQLA
jgi:SEC-C motif-containing protein